MSVWESKHSYPCCIICRRYSDCRAVKWLESMHWSDQTPTSPSWKLWSFFLSRWAEVCPVLLPQPSFVLQSLLARIHSTQTGCLAVPQACTAPWHTTEENMQVNHWENQTAYLASAWLERSCFRCWDKSFFSRESLIQARARPTSVFISLMFWTCLKWEKKNRYIITELLHALKWQHSAVWCRGWTEKHLLT